MEFRVVHFHRAFDSDSDSEFASEIADLVVVDVAAKTSWNPFEMESETETAEHSRSFVVALVVAVVGLVVGASA